MATKVTKKNTKKVTKKATKVNTNNNVVNNKVTITLKQAQSLAVKLEKANVKVPAFLANKLV